MNIDMYGKAVVVAQLLLQAFIYEPVAMPRRFLIVGLCQADGFFHESVKGIGLGQRLSVLLINPCLWPVGGNDDERNLSVPRFCHGRQ